MPTLYVARSPSLEEWGSDVGLTKHVYKIGVAEGTAEEAVAALNEEAYAGQTDWKVMADQPVDGLDEERVIQRLSRKEKLIEPEIYPRIKGARGIFKVKVQNVENHLVVKRVMAGEEQKIGKAKTADIAAYILANAQG